MFERREVLFVEYDTIHHQSVNTQKKNPQSSVTEKSDDLRVVEFVSYHILVVKESFTDDLPSMSPFLTVESNVSCYVSQRENRCHCEEVLGEMTRRPDLSRFY